MNTYFFLISTIFITIAWTFIIFFHGRNFFSGEPFFWASSIIFEKIHKIKDCKKTCPKNVCVIIPARDEEKCIQSTLNNLIEQQIQHLHIILVNDNSKDNTVKKALETFKKNSFKSFKIINGKALAVGWTGKVWALKQGIDSIHPQSYDYILMMDSDIHLKENIIKNVIDFLELKQLVMVSLMAKLNCTSIWEKLLIPPFIFFFQKIYPFNNVNKANKKISAAAGGFIFCKSHLFFKRNLFNKIHNKVIDDCNLATLIKEKGGIWLGLTQRVISKRKYTKLSDIWTMVSRTAFEQLDHSIFFLLSTIFGLFILYIAPLSNLFFMNSTTDTIPFYFNLFAVAMIFLSILPTLKFYRLNFLFCFSLPFSAMLYGMMTMSSATNFFLNKGNIWKGRKY